MEYVATYPDWIKESKSEKPIVLYDLDRTLADYDHSLRRDLAKIASPDEPTFTDLDEGKIPSWLAARIKLIRGQTDWWLNLPQFKLGWDILNLTGKMNCRHMVLTKGPRSVSDSWRQKYEWCRKYLPDETEISVVTNKSFMYGDVLVDDDPKVFLPWIHLWKRFSCNPLVIVPTTRILSSLPYPKDIVMYDGTNLDEIAEILTERLKVQG